MSFDMPPGTAFVALRAAMPSKVLVVV